VVYHTHRLTSLITELFIGFSILISFLFLLVFLPFTATHVTVAWSVRLSGCLSSVTVVPPAKAVGRNGMPFGRDTHVAPSITVLDTGANPHGKG